MSDKQHLVDALSERSILDLTSKLVALPSRNPPGEEKECAEFIWKTLVDWGLEAELIEEPNADRPQVVAWLRGTDEGKTLVLNGHIDTVGEGDRSKWETPPFEAVVRDGRLFGLGACDMKASLAVGMLILKSLSDSKVRLPGTLMFQAAMGEEMAEAGTRTLLRLGYTGDYAIVMEPTDLRIALAARGAVWHRVALEAEAVHCGLTAPDDVDLMMHFSNLSSSIFNYHQRVSAQRHALLAPPGCRITEVRAGHAHNTTPGKCEFIVDRRMLPHESSEQVKQDLKQILDSAMGDPAGFKYQLTNVKESEPTEISPDCLLVDVLRRNAQTLMGRTVEFCGTPFGSDMRNFVHDSGIPAVNFGAGDFRVCHNPNEFIPVSDLTRFAKITMATVSDILADS